MEATTKEAVVSMLGKAFGLIAAVTRRADQEKIESNALLLDNGAHGR